MSQSASVCHDGIGTRRVTCGPNGYVMPFHIDGLIEGILQFEKSGGLPDQWRRIITSINVHEYMHGHYRFPSDSPLQSPTREPIVAHLKTMAVHGPVPTSIEFMGELYEIAERPMAYAADLAKAASSPWRFFSKRTLAQSKHDLDYVISLAEEAERNPGLPGRIVPNWFGHGAQVVVFDRTYLTKWCEVCKVPIDAAMLEIHQSRPTHVMGLMRSGVGPRVHTLRDHFAAADVAKFNLCQSYREMNEYPYGLENNEEYTAIQPIWHLIHRYAKYIPSKYSIVFPEWLMDAADLFISSEIGNAMSFEEYIQSIIEGRENG